MSVTPVIVYPWSAEGSKTTTLNPTLPTPPATSTWSQPQYDSGNYGRGTGVNTVPAFTTGGGSAQKVSKSKSCGIAWLVILTLLMVAVFIWLAVTYATVVDLKAQTP